MNELCRNVALEGKTSTTTAKTVWRIMCRIKPIALVVVERKEQNDDT